MQLIGREHVQTESVLWNDGSVCWSVFQDTGAVWNGIVLIIFLVFATFRFTSWLWRYYFHFIFMIIRTALAEKKTEISAISFPLTPPKVQPVSPCVRIFLGFSSRRFGSGLSFTFPARWDGWQRSAETQARKHRCVRRSAGRQLGERVPWRAVWPGRGQRSLRGWWEDSGYLFVLYHLNLILKYHFNTNDVLFWSPDENL